MKLASAVVRAQGKPLARPDEMRPKILKRVTPVAAALPPALLRKYRVEERVVAGRPVVVLAPKSSKSSWHIIYTHGGAYVMDLVKPHWDIIEALIDATGATVTVPLYRVAPEANYQEAYSFLTEVYQQTLETTKASNIVLAGDSAGGGLAIGQAVHFRNQGLPLPARIVALSPWLDITLANNATASVEPFDIMLAVDGLRQCGQWWAAGDDGRAPLLSPLYADLNGLPPIDIFQGTHDLLVVDARTFVAKARSTGAKVSYFEYPEAFHVFMAAAFIPESKDVYSKIAQALPRSVLPAR